MVPIIRLSDRPDSYRPRVLFGDLGVRAKGELVGVDFTSPVFARKLVRGLDGVEAMVTTEWACQAMYEENEVN